MPTLVVKCSKCKVNLDQYILSRLDMTNPQCPCCEVPLTIPWAMDAKHLLHLRATAQSNDTNPALLDNFTDD